MKTTCKKSGPVNLMSDIHFLDSVYFLQLKLFLRFSQISMLLPIYLYLRAGFLPAMAGYFFYFVLKEKVQT